MQAGETALTAHGFGSAMVGRAMQRPFNRTIAIKNVPDRHACLTTRATQLRDRMACSKHPLNQRRRKVLQLGVAGDKYVGTREQGGGKVQRIGRT